MFQHLDMLAMSKDFVGLG